MLGTFTDLFLGAVLGLFALSIIFLFVGMMYCALCEIAGVDVKDTKLSKRLKEFLRGRLE